MDEGFPLGSKRSHWPVKTGKWTRDRATWLPLQGSQSANLFPWVQLSSWFSLPDGLLGENCTELPGSRSWDNQLYSTGLELCREEPKTFSCEHTTSTLDTGNKQYPQPPPSCPTTSQHWPVSAVISCEHLQACPPSLPSLEITDIPWRPCEDETASLSVSFYCVMETDSQLS